MDINISLPNDLMTYIDQEKKSGRFSSSSEIVEVALRLLRSQDNEVDGDLERLRAAWSEGMESGDFRELDFSALKAEARRLMTEE